ncbi:hypothetical protein [Pseudomonas chlororaphis]|uniref:hypothetical protein n=1 Tax=Pseudomonas chlororaphis TaxID=587753 RepID=UPI0039E0E024
MDLYTVDRGSRLSTGATCSLVEHEDIRPAEIAEMIRELCPGGVSQHGDKYLVSALGQEKMVTDADTEILFEWVRRAKYPNKPSRYQSLFAVDSLGAADAFKREFQVIEAPVYRVASEHAFRADMRLLDPRMSAAVKSWFANLYWQGLPHPAAPAFWEWLVPCPVVIGERVI